MFAFLRFKPQFYTGRMSQMGEDHLLVLSGICHTSGHPVATLPGLENTVTNEVLLCLSAAGNGLLPGELQRVGGCLPLRAAFTQRHLAWASASAWMAVPVKAW